MICSGNSSEYCGGPNRLNIYQNAPKASTSAASISTSSAPSSSVPSLNDSTSSVLTSSFSLSSTLIASSATPSPTGPVHVQTVGAFQFQGCFNESNGIRALGSASYVNVSTTVEMCAGLYLPGGLAWMGVEYGHAW